MDSIQDLRGARFCNQFQVQYWGIFWVFEKMIIFSLSNVCLSNEYTYNKICSVLTYKCYVFKLNVESICEYLLFKFSVSLYLTCVHSWFLIHGIKNSERCTGSSLVMVVDLWILFYNFIRFFFIYFTVKLLGMRRFMINIPNFGMLLLSFEKQFFLLIVLARKKQRIVYVSIQKKEGKQSRQDN